MTIRWERFPSVLKARRAATGLSQAQVAAAVGAAWNTIARLETGNRRPSFEMLEKLSEVFGCAVADLLPETKSRTRRK